MRSSNSIRRFEAARPLLADQVADVPVVLGANELEDLFVREIGDALLGPRLREYARVVNGDFDFKMAGIGAMVALDDVQFVRMRMGFLIEINPVVERHAIDDQRVAVPMSDRVPIPGRVRIGGMTTGVEINLMEAWTFVV